MLHFNKHHFQIFKSIKFKNIFLPNPIKTYPKIFSKNKKFTSDNYKSYLYLLAILFIGLLNGIPAKANEEIPGVNDFIIPENPYKYSIPGNEIKPSFPTEPINSDKPVFTKQSQFNNQVESAPASQKVKLSLADIVYLVVENNTEIKNAYLDRIAQRADLAVEEDKFVPDFTPTASVSVNQLGRNGITSGNLDTSVGARVVMRIPTGGEINFGWTGNAETTNLDDFSTSVDGGFRQNIELSFRQPILKNAGIRINQASIQIARINEKINIENLKSTLINTISEAILAYRELIRAQERVKIEQLSLQNAQESLEITQILINAGRIAPVEIIQNQTAVANRRVSLLSAENELEASRLALLSILDIDNNTNIEAEGIPAVKPTTLDANKLRKIALTNQPDYLEAQLNVEKNQLDLLLAEDNKRWDLSVNASLLGNTNEPTDARVGLSLSRNFGDLTLEQRFERVRVDVLKSENIVKDIRSRLDIELQDRIRNVDLSFSQLQLARQATQLSARQLEIEQEKLKLGRGTGVFELISLQNELAEARNAELDATISYLNALTRLDQLIGTTLQTWQISIENTD